MVPVLRRNQKHARECRQRQAQKESAPQEPCHVLGIVAKEDLERPVHPVWDVSLGHLQQPLRHNGEPGQVLDELGLPVEADASLDKVSGLDIRRRKGDGVQNVLLGFSVHVPHGGDRQPKVQVVQVAVHHHLDGPNEAAQKGEGHAVLAVQVILLALLQVVLLRQVLRGVVYKGLVLFLDRFHNLLEARGVRGNLQDELHHLQPLAEEVANVRV
mmetsp:Transcript_115465/g.274430  ORF Transcript_115465/g.274430 Transcript_115465/m.274430 type:complete len:214 (+) Transcript_115465:1296-1937(+)